MSAYVIVEIEGVTDRAGYERYKEMAPESIARHGGRYIVRGGRCETLEGEWAPGRIVVLEFPSAERVRAWWDGEAYREAKALRQRTARTRMIVVEGL